MKAILRKQAVTARNGLSREERQIKSREIENRLFRLPEFVASATIAFFVSFRSEVDTMPMIRHAFALGKAIVLPKVQGKSLVFCAITDIDKDVSPGTRGILEPIEKNPVDLHTVDSMIVPGLAFDEHGNRLGHGAGFYDQVLARYKGATIALAFELQITPKVPVTVHDVPVKKIVTGKRIIEAR